MGFDSPTTVLMVRDLERHAHERNAPHYAPARTIMMAARRAARAARMHR